MGVKLTPIVQDQKKIITFENLVGKKIAIDAFNTLFQFLAIIRGYDGTPLKDFQGNVTSHLSGLFYRTINILEKDIKPIFVFDGPPNPLKKAEIERRRAIRNDATKKFHEAQDLGEMKEAAKFAQASSRLNTAMIEESKEFIQAMGIPIVQAKQDGEAQAAYLVQKDAAWAVGTQDYDALLFGAPRIVRNLSQNRTRKVKSTIVKVDLEWLSLPKVLEANNLSQSQLVDIGILTGVDFFPGIEGVGSKTAFKLIQDYNTLDEMWEKNITIRKKPIQDLLEYEKIGQIRDIFLKPAVSTNYPELKWHKPNPEKIKEILCEKHNFDLTRVESAISRLKKKAGSSQKTMNDFFKL
ncbi:MAG: flap endonuclease-1 [Promethearchaeota archaeon]